MLHSNAISRRKWALLTVLALVASLFFGLSTASQAQPDCDIAEPQIGASPEISGGTRIVLTVRCDAHEQEVIETLVRVGETVFVKDVETVGARAGAFLHVVKDVAVGQVGLEVCQSVPRTGEQVCVRA